MKPHINFLIRCGIVVVLIIAFVIISNNTDPAEVSHDYTEPARTAPTEPSEPTKNEAPTDMPSTENEAHAAPERKPEPKTPYTEEELDMLALIIYQEAGGDACSDETRLMVGTVVMNRITDDRYPNTMHEVITQKSQYGRLYWTGLVWPQRANTPEETHAVERAYTIAERILLGERTLPEDVVYQAEFEQGTETVAYQDGIYFCR